MRDALREYVQRYMKELDKLNFEITDSILILEEEEKLRKEKKRDSSSSQKSYALDASFFINVYYKEN